MITLKAQRTAVLSWKKNKKNFISKKLDIGFEWAYNNTCPSSKGTDEKSAGVAELADAQDLKSCGPFDRTGSIPVLGTTF